MKMPPQRTQLQQKFVAYEILYIFLYLIILSNAFESTKTKNIDINTLNNALANEKVDLSASSEFSAYKIIRPEIHNGYNKASLQHTLDQENGQHIPYFVLKYYHEGLVVSIDLKLNDELLPDQHFLRFQDSKANTKYIVKNFTKTESELCHYQGSIRGKPHSRVAVSTCNGDINGIVFDSTDAYIIHAERNGTMKSQHFLFRASDLRNKNATCSHKNAEPEIFTNSFIRQKRSNSEEILHHGPYKANKRSLYVELVVVVDNGLYRFFEEHMGKVHQYCKDLTNIMNALYAPLNIFVILMGVVVWNERDEILFDNDARETLHRFLEYRSLKLTPEHPNDHAQLLTKNKFYDNIVGKAFVGPMCTKEKSGAVCVAHSPIIAVVANTMAHEMGHVFGMSHDDRNCKCPDKKCIMSDTSSSYIPTHWSSCSINNLTQAISRGVSYCLRNKPTKLFSSSLCGNGFVEPGEECDCGLPNFCKSKCCDPYTCRLRSNATCGSGECCDLESCKLKKEGTVCRPADTECDLSEFCTGETEFCPKDVYKHDTADCSNGAGYCYQGKCGSHERQCRILWGSAATNSEHCYSTANKHGDNTGNCGYDLQTNEYIKCEEQHVNCGKLQCNHPRDWQKFGIASLASQTWTSYAFYKRSYRECRSAIFDFGLHTPDPGMVPNGAKCGAEKMCIEQKCISIEKLRAAGVAKTCDENCNGNGICNSEGHCHCDIGFAGSSCRAIGAGGSVDSGPATNSDSHAAFQRFLLIFFCCAIPVALSFCLLFYFYRKKAFSKLKKFIKNDKSAISVVVCEASTATHTLLKPAVNNVQPKQQLTLQQEIARSIEQLNRVETVKTNSSTNSVDTLNLPKVHESIENLTKTFRKSFVSKSASNYELSTLSDSTTIPTSSNRKLITPVIAKKSFKSATSLAARTDNVSNKNSNNSLRPKLEITDVRLQSSTNPLAVALSQGVSLVRNNNSNTHLNT